MNKFLEGDMTKIVIVNLTMAVLRGIKHIYKTHNSNLAIISKVIYEIKIKFQGMRHSNFGLDILLSVELLAGISFLVPQPL
jgi:hypothetical protein